MDWVQADPWAAPEEAMFLRTRGLAGSSLREPLSSGFSVKGMPRRYGDELLPSYGELGTLVGGCDPDLPLMRVSTRERVRVVPWLEGPRDTRPAQVDQFGVSECCMQWG